MNFWNWMFRSGGQPEQPPQPEREIKGYFDTVAAADVHVDTSVIGSAPRVTNPDMAMKLSTVFRCTDILSSSVAALPLVVKRNRGGYFLPDEGNPLNYLLNFKPNSRLNAFDFKKNMVVQMLNQGNAYLYPEWNSDGEPDRITLLSPYSVAYEKMQDVCIISDTVNNIFATVDMDDMVHIKNMSLDGGYTGVSTIRYASQVMSINAAADTRSFDSFQPGASYKGFISGNNEGERGLPNFEDEQLGTVADRVGKELRSGKNIMFLQGDMKFNQLSMSPADIQLLETKKFGVLEICRFYGVHPDLVFAGQSQNYKASGLSQVQYLTGTLQALLRKIETEFFVKLIPRSLANKYRIEFDLDSYYQADLETLGVYMEKTINCGVMRPNDWRRKRGYAPTPGGDQTFISCNVAPIDSPKIQGTEKKVDGMPGGSKKMPPKNEEPTDI